MTLNEWFTKGLAERTYVHNMEKNRENLLTVYNQYAIHQKEKELLQKLQKKKLRALVITADWCGDAMVNVPIFMRIANEALIDARYFIRDEHLDLMDQYLTNGTARSIPIIVIIDQDGKEVGNGDLAQQKLSALSTRKSRIKMHPILRKHLKCLRKKPHITIRQIVTYGKILRKK
ncbi:thioredoxin family protein [Bacillus sp. B6(2022)]|nr:thioredoxin family protein [Bacillus sp. B6(2022)]